MVSTIYSKSAAARILGVAIAAVRELQVWANCVWVRTRHLCRFISFGAFERDFVESRQERATSLNVFPVGDRGFNVSGGEGVHRVVTADSFDGMPSCTCSDWAAHSHRPGFKCKHLIAAECYEAAQPKPQATLTPDDVVEAIEIENELAWEAEVQNERHDRIQWRNFDATVVCGVSID